MRNPWANKSEYAFSSWTFSDVDLRRAIQEIAESGFRTLEIWADSVHLDPRLNTDLSQVLGWLKEAQIDVHSIHAPFSPSIDRTRTKLNAEGYLGLWHQSVMCCSDLRCPVMVIHARCLSASGALEVDAMEVSEMVNNLALFAKQQGVKIALENTPGIHPGTSLYWTLENQKKMLDLENVGYCLDIGHAPLTHADLFREVDAVVDDLVSFHIHNNDLIHDLHSLPDQGLLDWGRLYQYVRDKGYAGQFVLEIAGDGDPFKRLADTAKLFG